MLLPGLPRCLFRARWALMRYNPLCWQLPRCRYTVGEALALAVLVGQLVWTSTAWLLDLSDFRHDVRKTGAAPVACHDRCTTTLPQANLAQQAECQTKQMTSLCHASCSMMFPMQLSAITIVQAA